MVFGNTPKDNAATPLGSVYVPGTAGSDLTALEGMAINTDGNSQKSSAARMGAKANDIVDLATLLTLAGTSGDANTVASLMGRLTKIRDLLNATLSVQAPDLSTSATLSAAQATLTGSTSNATVSLAIGQGQSTWKAQLVDGGGGFTSGTTIVADKSIDGGATWYAASFKVSGASPATSVSSVVGPGPLEITGNAGSVSHVRIRMSVRNSTETVAVTLRAGTGISEVGLLSSIPAGTNVIGGVTQSGTWTEANSANIKTDLDTIAGAISSSKMATKAASGDFADGAITAIGAKADAAITDSTTTNTQMSFIKGFVKILADVWDSANHRFNVAVQNANANGQNTMANSAPVTFASDQSPLTAATGTQTTVASSASSGTLLASNANRKTFMLWNDSTQLLYVLFKTGGTASTTVYSIQIGAQQGFVWDFQPIFTGAVIGIWAAANGNARVTEFTA